MYWLRRRGDPKGDIEYVVLQRTVGLIWAEVDGLAATRSARIL